MRVLVIDNYDSFTWNLVHCLQALGATVKVVRNDAIGAPEEAVDAADAILISPGPGDPDSAGVSLDVVTQCAVRELPLLGVCLGHQAIAQVFGGRIVRADRIMHGKTSSVIHDASGVFAGLPSPVEVARYHSLCVSDDNLPADLRITARADDGTIMGLSHRSLPMHGVQFHPESIATAYGSALVGNFLAMVAARSSTA